MSLTSIEFLVFVIVAVVGYYIIPKRCQWMWLLLFSYIYYASAGIQYLGLILYTTLVTYGTALVIHRIDQTDEAHKKDAKQKKKGVLILALLFVFGLLGVLKYTNFIVQNIDQLFHTDFGPFHLLLPIGLSFYTFQSAGYILDVYWNRCEPEKNVFRFALFVSFFPQILQGPIGRFDRLTKTLYAEHEFDWQRIERGVQRIIWGFFKKMLIADTAAVFVDAIFNQYQTYNGIAILGVLAYSAQLYADFSGGVDVVIGVAELFGVEMDENFKRPYFAVSITDFWHRWHITLGTWMKDYVFYPVSLSGWMGKFGKFAKKKFGKTYGRALPICVANLIVFLVVGIWHGAAWKFIVYGIYNGVIIAFSGLMTKNYREWKKKLHIDDKSTGWHIFQIIRTFLLVNISWYFDRADTIPQALTMMKNSVTYFEPAQILNIQFGQMNLKYTPVFIAVLLVCCAICFVVSFLQERGTKIRQSLSTKIWVIRWAIYLAMIFAMPLLGRMPDTAGGFIYAQF